MLIPGLSIKSVENISKPVMIKERPEIQESSTATEENMECK